MILLTGCSESAHPKILEPIIQLSEASDISRTSANLTASIDRRGEAKLSRLALIYAQTDNGTPIEIKGDPSSETIDFQISNLYPGTSYTCYIEGGTSTATLKSNTISFTTMPNVAPAISSATPLSTGPLGIIVEFSIVDDGGSPIMEAGCEIMTAGGDESHRVELTKENLKVGKWQLSITGLTPLTSYIITTFATNSIGKAQGEALEYTTRNSIVLQQPGNLADLFGSDTDHDFDCLTISGPMNGDDFRTLRAILGAPGKENQIGINANNIDLTDVDITEGGDSYDGKRYTVTDEVTTDLFSDCALLRKAILPNTAKILARNAFARCLALESITISAGMTDVIPSADCLSLKDIEVSKANSLFSSIDGVLFNQNATELLWFPHGKGGEYQLPSTLKAIGENAFAGTSITKITIPSSVTIISRGAFAGSALTEIILPESITHISEGLFQNCSHLNNVYLGSATEYVGDFVFDGTAIKKLYLAAEIPPYTSDNAFANGKGTIFSDCTLYIPQGTKDIYRNHSKWGKFSHIEEFQP